MRARLFAANANRCCVCKSSDIGLELHHIDGNCANTVAPNLAVLCVSDHDCYHRQPASGAVNHRELTQNRIRQYKRSWEAFVAEARKDKPTLLATVTGYGTRDFIHSAELVMQWPDRVEYRKVYSLRTGDMDRWTDDIIKEVIEVGRKIKIVVVPDAMPDLACGKHGIGLSTIYEKANAMRLIDEKWATDSLAVVYAYPDRPSIDIALGIGKSIVMEGALWLVGDRCFAVELDGEEGRFELSASSEVRTQVSQVIETMLRGWNPARVLFATDESSDCSFAEKLNLPKFWETMPSSISLPVGGSGRRK